jgi:DNA-binding GntR family transcriptional regulator
MASRSRAPSPASSPVPSARDLAFVRPRADGSRGAGPRANVHARVAAELRRALMTGVLVPGQTMSLRRLASHLGTSPMPVRGAITQLTAAGVLEPLPNGSVAVPRLNPERFRDLVRVRVSLEGLAAEDACRNATPALIKRLETLNEELRRAVRARDLLVCLAKNYEFHFALYAASGSELLPDLIEALWLRAGPLMYFSLTLPGMPWDATAHDDLIRALKARKPAAARRAAERDIENTAKQLLKSAAVFRGDFGPLAGLALR